MSQELIDAAREYLTLNLSVIALEGKMPNRIVHPQGLLNAMSGVPEDDSDFELLRWAFNHPKTTGVGIVIQPPYFVVDVDGPVGAERLVALLGDDWLAEIGNTPVARTIRGLHIWFADTVEHRSLKLGEQLDLKGSGGYVCAPPSRHPAGGVYTWIEPMRVNGPLELPSALAEDLRGRRKAMDTPTYATPRVWREHVLVGERGARRFECVDMPATMGGLEHRLRTTRPGDRNNILLWAAAAAAEDGFTLPDIMATLGPVAEEIGLPVVEIKTTIKSGYRRGARKR